MATLSPEPRAEQLAREALEVALSYLEEVRADLTTLVTNPSSALDLLNTVSLAAKQLDEAQRHDPTATLTIEDTNGQSNTLDQTLLRSQALAFEGICHSVTDPKRAIPILERATELDPSNPIPYQALGMAHADLFNKQEAVAAYEQAVALRPDDIELRKELDRARNMPVTSVVVDRTARGVRAAWNVGSMIVSGIILLVFLILAWNVIVLFTASNDEARLNALATVVAILLLFAIVGFISSKVQAVRDYLRNLT